MSNTVQQLGQKKLASGINAAVMIVAVLGLVVGVNWIGTSSYTRIDLTEGNINSLSATSVGAVEKMADLEFRLYVSKKLPKVLAGPAGPIENAPQLVMQLEDKLEEYQRASQGKLTIRVISDDLQTQAGALGLAELRIPSEKAGDADPEALNQKYFIGLSVHYRTVEETIPAITNPLKFEYDITKTLLRLQAKQEASGVLKDLLDTGKQLNESVEKCVEAIKKHDKSEKKKDDAEGGIVEQIQKGQSETKAQIDAFFAGMPQIEAACGKISGLIKAQRDVLTKDAGEGVKGRALSKEHMRTLLDRLAWFDGFYGAWLASLVNGKQDPMLLDRLVKLLEHPEVSARTAALRVLAGWIAPSQEGQPPIAAGPALQQTVAALRRGLDDAEPTVRAVAVQLIAQAAGDQAGEEIQKALKDADPTVREVALDLAMQLKIPVDVSALDPFLKDADWQVRRMAAAYLIENKTGQDRLKALLADPNPTVKFVAAYGLAELGDKESAAKIQEVMNTMPPGQFREVLRESLEKLNGGGAAPPSAPEGGAPVPSAPPSPEGGAPVPSAPPSPEGGAPPATPPPGPAAPQPPRPPKKAQKSAGMQKALGRAGTDKIGDIGLPDPMAALKTFEDLKSDIGQLYNTLKDSPGRKNIGFLCGHEEFCPFAETESKIPKELAQAFEQQPFMKKAVDDIRQLEEAANQTAEAFRNFFLSRGYRVVKVEAGKRIGDDVDALVIYGPRKPFKDIDLYDVDQFIMTGKPVMFLLNNYEVVVNQWDEKPPYRLTTKIQSTDTNLDGFFHHFGIKNGKDLVFETDKSLNNKINAVSIAQTNIGELPNKATYAYPAFPIFEKFSATNPLVSGFSRITLPFVSSLSAIDSGNTGLSVEPLITSSEAAVAKDKDFVLDPKQLQVAIGTEKVTGPHHVAVQATAKSASSFFAGKPRPERPKEEEKPPKEGEPPRPPKKEDPERPQVDKGPVNIVVLGSNLGIENVSPSRILDGFNLGAIAQEKVTGLGAAVPYFVRFINARGRFIWPQNPIHLGNRTLTQLPGQQSEFWQQSVDVLFGLFDWMSGDSGLIEIRGKEKKFTDRPLKVMTQGKQNAVKYGLTLALPLAFVLFGFIRLGLRKAGRKRLTVGA